MTRPSLHDRLFRALLALFPAEFRGDFGDAMSADFRDQQRDAEGRPRETRRLWIRTIVDLLSRAPREHLDVLTRDARYAVRVLRRHPASSATAVLSLAIGIGLNSAVFSVVSSVLWRSLPFPDGHRLVSVGVVTPTQKEPRQILSATYLDLQRQTRTLDRLTAAAIRSMTIVGPGDPAHIVCFAVTQGFFDLLGVKPILGRGLTQADYDDAMAYRAAASKTSVGPSAPTMVLRHSLWQRRFGSDPNVVGTDIRIAGGDRVRIVGVTGPELEQAGRSLPGQCWMPHVPDAAHGMWMPYLTIGRIAPGRSVKEANAELDAIGSTLGPDAFSKEPQTLRAMPLLDQTVMRVRTQLLFLFGAVVCVLLVTCANVVNLFLAHAAGRRDELTTRVALGASRARLVRQSLTESLVISLFGGALGFLLAVWGVPLLVSLAPELPRSTTIGVDWSTFAFTLGVSVAIGLLCGLAAALPTRLPPRTLFGAVRAPATPRAMRLRRAVTVGEVALALMLAIAASLMVRTVRALNAIDLGFDPRAVVSADLPSAAGSSAAAQDLHMAIVERVKALDGVKAAGVGIGPLSGGMFIGGVIVPDNPRAFDLVGVDAVSPGYFEALGARLLAGRLFRSGDAVRGGPAVILVNQSAARAFWGDSNPIGKTLVINKTEQLQVVGVIADIRGSSLERNPGPTMYQLANQSRNFLANSMVIRVDGDPQALVPRIRAVIQSMNREMPFSGVEPLQTRIDRAMAPRLFVLRVIGLFSVLGVILAVVGVYGVLAEFVVQRVPEMGIRMALGATASDVLALILSQGARLVAIGLALGLGGAVLMRGVMSTMVYGVRTFDPFAYFIASLILFAATVAACAVPAMRAARLDPVAALRSD